MNESDLREKLAPRVAAKILARMRAPGIDVLEAERLAHEIIGMVQGAALAAQTGAADL